MVLEVDSQLPNNHPNRRVDSTRTPTGTREEKTLYGKEKQKTLVLVHKIMYHIYSAVNLTAQLVTVPQTISGFVKTIKSGFLLNGRPGYTS